MYRVLRRHDSPSHSPCALVAFPLKTCVAEKLILSRYLICHSSIVHLLAHLTDQEPTVLALLSLHFAMRLLTCPVNLRPPV